MAGRAQVPLSFVCVGGVELFTLPRVLVGEFWEASVSILMGGFGKMWGILIYVVWGEPSTTTIPGSPDGWQETVWTCGIRVVRSTGAGDPTTPPSTCSTVRHDSALGQ